MESQPEQVTVDAYELDRQAWNLPLPAKRPKAPQAPLSVQSGGEDRTRPESEAA
jgi:hypothetical protein